MDIIVKTDFNSLPKTIESNIEEKVKEVKEIVDYANSLIIDPKQLADIEFAESKATRLTKDAQEIAKFRKALTARWAEPIEEIVSTCSTLEHSLKDASDTLKAKAKVGRDEAREIKKEELREMWESALDSYGFNAKNELPSIKFSYMEGSGFNIPHFARFFANMTNENTKGCWTNRSLSKNKIREDMVKEIERCVTALKTYDTMTASELPSVAQVGREILLDRFDIGDATSAMVNYKSQQERLAKMEAEREAQKAAATASFVKDDESVKANEGSDSGASDEPNKTFVEEPCVMTFVLKVTGKREDLVNLRIWGEQHGITFKKVQ